MMLGFALLVCVGQCVNHIVKVIEPTWVEEYGKNYPVKVMLTQKKILLLSKMGEFTGKKIWVKVLFGWIINWSFE
jgi:hypothetical protein